MKHSQMLQRSTWLHFSLRQSSARHELPEGLKPKVVQTFFPWVRACDPPPHPHSTKVAYFMHASVLPPPLPSLLGSFCFVFLGLETLFFLPSPPPPPSSCSYIHSSETLTGLGNEGKTREHIFPMSLLAHVLPDWTF